MSSLRLAIKRSAEEAAALAPKPPPASVRKTIQVCYAASFNASQHNITELSVRFYFRPVSQAYSIERFIAKGLLRAWNGSHIEVRFILSFILNASNDVDPTTIF